ncbi:inosine 5'-monophosphate dehydrogenase [Mariprofundus micogutta]|uniref:Inosine 5'-monophosphate dehydrogenase n=1 Tax=Mariprofundus micogutta TaxID=1921010 RepID=A0A1L8CNZ6_9PROT|nr:CBS domain-containing protein [Mariprofundus micogutta]GAV20641.1 inosine 5'-monophosphate dehydrogenase [Mariprofundus micogutta]
MFTVYGPGVTDPIRLEKLLERHAIAKAGAVTAKQPIKQEKGQPQSLSAYQSAHVKQRYQAVETADERDLTLNASQLMTSPVKFVYAHTTALEVLKILDAGGFHHIPVMSSENQLVGMVSDRDVIRCMCGSDTICLHCSKDKQAVLVSDLMKDHVLTATVETDARYIARLFVEKRIGAIPVMENGGLVGIITRSDILRAVMLHFDLNIWT